MENVNESNAIGVPEREEYQFAALEGADSLQYALEDVLTIPDGTTVTFVWNAKAD
jgi:hypothetical protein